MHRKSLGQCQAWKKILMTISNNSGDGGSDDDKGFGVFVLQHYNTAFSDKKSDHIICQGYLNLLLWKGKLLLCHLMAAM